MGRRVVLHGGMVLAVQLVLFEEVGEILIEADLEE